MLKLAAFVFAVVLLGGAYSFASEWMSVDGYKPVSAHHWGGGHRNGGGRGQGGGNWHNGGCYYN